MIESNQAMKCAASDEERDRLGKGLSHPCGLFDDLRRLTHGVEYGKDDGVRLGAIAGVAGMGKPVNQAVGNQVNKRLCHLFCLPHLVPGWVFLAEPHTVIYESVGHPIGLGGRGPVPASGLNLAVNHPLNPHDDDVLGQPPPVAQAVEQSLDCHANLSLGFHHTPRTMDMRSGSTDSRE